MARKQILILILHTLDKLVLVSAVSEAQGPLSREALAAVFTMGAVTSYVVM